MNLLLVGELRLLALQMRRSQAGDLLRQGTAGDDAPDVRSRISAGFARLRCSGQRPLDPSGLLSTRFARCWTERPMVTNLERAHDASAASPRGSRRGLSFMLTR